MEQELLNILETVFIGKNIIYFESINSTQLEAKKVKNDVPDGSIIITNNQIAGIGTHDRSWYMGENDNIAFTIVLKPKCHINKVDGLTILIAKCMAECIDELYGKEICIKEPNDLMINNKKIGGILTQATTKKETIEDILIGIGLNVNQINFPEELNDIATSLKREFYQDFDRVKIIAKFLNIFERKYKEIIN